MPAPDWPHPHPPRQGCGCDHCYAWLIGRHVVNDPDPVQTWHNLYDPAFEESEDPPGGLDPSEPEGWDDSTGGRMKSAKPRYLAEAHEEIERLRYTLDRVESRLREAASSGLSGHQVGELAEVCSRALNQKERP